MEVSRPEATAASINLFISTSLLILTDDAYTASNLHQSIMPFFSVGLPHRSIQLVGGGVLSRFSGRLRGSRLGRTFYANLARNVKIFLRDATCIAPSYMEDWRSLIASANLVGILSLSEWIPVIYQLSGSWINSPAGRSDWSHAEVSLIAANFHGPRAILSIWRAALCRPNPNTVVTPTSTRSLLGSPPYWHRPSAHHILTPLNLRSIT